MKEENEQPYLDKPKNKENSSNTTETLLYGDESSLKETEENKKKYKEKKLNE